MTSGGTESIILAVKAARDHARAHRPEVVDPEMVLPITAHPAFHKAAHYLGLGVVTTSVDTGDFRADVAAFREALGPNTVLGVGMGSRLFQNIRERHGVAYSVYSFVDFFKDNGLLAIYLGTERNKKDKAIALIEKELKNLRGKPLSQGELQRIKAQLKGNLILGLENSAKRMSRLAKMEIYLQKYQDVDQIISDIDKVSSESVSSLVQQLFAMDQMLQVVFLPN